MRLGPAQAVKPFRPSPGLCILDTELQLDTEHLFTAALQGRCVQDLAAQLLPMAVKQNRMTSAKRYAVVSSLHLHAVYTLFIRSATMLHICRLLLGSRCPDGTPLCPPGAKRRGGASKVREQWPVTGYFHTVYKLPDVNVLAYPGTHLELLGAHRAGAVPQQAVSTTTEADKSPGCVACH